MAETLTQAGLAGLASQMPVRNKTIADQQRAARLLQLQQAVSQMTPQQAPTSAQASQMGATMAAQAGQQQVQRAQQQVQEAGQLAKLGQQETELEAAKRVSALQVGAQKEQLDQTARLAALDDRTKREIFDAELQFKRDQNDAALFSERQLADYKRLNAERDQDYSNWAQQAKQMHDRNITMLETLGNKLAEIEKNNYYVGKQQLDQAQKQELMQLRRDNAMRLAKARAKAANSSNMWSSAGGILSTIGTGLVMSGVAAPVGAGMIAGGTLASAQASREKAKAPGSTRLPELEEM